MYLFGLKFQKKFINIYFCGEFIYISVCVGGGGVRGLRNTRMRINLPNPDLEG